MGYVLVALPLLILSLRPRAVGRFVAESLRFVRTDIRWFARYPRFVLAPRRNPPAAHAGHFDPGQRVMNVVLVASLLVLAVTGMLLSFPERITPGAFAWSLRVHRVSTVVLAVALIGHIGVASGILPAYRGVWRAMHGDGRVPVELAGRLWPRWSDQQRTTKESKG